MTVWLISLFALLVSSLLKDNTRQDVFRLIYQLHSQFDGEMTRYWVDEGSLSSPVASTPSVSKNVQLLPALTRDLFTDFAKLF